MIVNDNTIVRNMIIVQHKAEQHYFNNLPACLLYSCFTLHTPGRDIRIPVMAVATMLAWRRLNVGLFWSFRVWLREGGIITIRDRDRT